MGKFKKNFKTPLNLACGNDDLREVIQYIVFRDGYAVCTDVHILVKQYLRNHGFEENEVEFMEGKAIHKDVFKEIMRFDTVNVDADGFNCVKGRVTSKIPFSTLGGKYPNYEAVIPTMEDKSPTESIGFNLKILSKVEKLTLNDNKIVELNLFGKNKAIVMIGKGLTFKDEIIMVMPCKL